MRYLAVDLGDKRTGLAVGDDELRMAQPVCVLEVPIGDLLITAITKAIEEQGKYIFDESLFIAFLI